jgi:hypothetical protein
MKAEFWPQVSQSVADQAHERGIRTDWAARNRTPGTDRTGSAVVTDLIAEGFSAARHCRSQWKLS